MIPPCFHTLYTLLVLQGVKDGRRPGGFLATIADLHRVCWLTAGIPMPFWSHTLSTWPIHPDLTYLSADIAG